MYIKNLLQPKFHSQKVIDEFVDKANLIRQ